MSMGNRPSFSREAQLQWAGSRETNLASGRGRTFFLTSLFIELIDDNCLSGPTQNVSQAVALIERRKADRQPFSARSLLPVPQ